MAKIALLDDDENILNMIKRKIESGWSDSNEISVFNAPDMFLESAENDMKYDVLITDIEMPGMSGVQVGKQYRELYPDAYLIFLTSHAHYAAESYTIDAYQYILKDDIEKRLPTVLNKLFKEIKVSNSAYRMIGTPTSKETVLYRNIIYIYKEKGSKYVNYVTTNGIYKERITINQLLMELDSEEFVLVERSYIININHISNMLKTVIYMDNGEQIAVSRAHFKNVKEQINIYRGKL